jgi:hypothetical protein
MSRLQALHQRSHLLEQQLQVSCCGRLSLLQAV